MSDTLLFGRLLFYILGARDSFPQIQCVSHRLAVLGSVHHATSQFYGVSFPSYNYDLLRWGG